MCRKMNVLDFVLYLDVAHSCVVEECIRIQHSELYKIKK